MTLYELENEDYPLVATIAGDIITQAPESIAAVYTDFIDTYGQTIDVILVTRHGRKEIDDYYLEQWGDTNTMYYQAIYAYLVERTQWIRQHLAYNDAEYDPIENFISHEEETIEDDMKQRHSVKTDTENAYSRTHTKEIPQVITEQYTEADITSETTQLKSTTENMVSPDDSDGYHNQTKAETTPGKITNTEKPYNRKYKTPQTTITDTDSLAAPKVESHAFTDDAHKDKHTRELDRHGNQGIQTAAQMMALDENFWNHNRWLSQMALDIANLICVRTEAI